MSVQSVGWRRPIGFLVSLAVFWAVVPIATDAQTSRPPGDASRLSALPATASPARTPTVALGSFEEEPPVLADPRLAAEAIEPQQPMDRTTPMSTEVDGFDPETSVELVAERRSDQKLYRNADGTRTALIFNGPVHILNAEGSWVEADPTLIGKADALVPKGVGYPVRLQQIGLGQPAVTFGEPGSRVRVGIIDALEVAPEVDGSTA